MMGIETMKSVSPKTVDRSTLVQRSSIRLDPAASQEVRLNLFAGAMDKRLSLWYNLIGQKKKNTD